MTAQLELPTLSDQIREWPLQPGVYVMRDGAGRILYVGKAKNLRNRIRSYFQNGADLSGKNRLLIKRVESLEFTVTNTELEALLLECNLIKKHRPRFNIRLKDDKNFPYVVLDFAHPFPQLRVSRKVIPSPTLKYFGPYSGSITEITRFLLKTFQIRDCSEAKFRNRTRPCLNYEIGTCTAPCVDYVSQEDYAKQIREVTLFLKGKKQQLLSDLRKEMKQASDKLEYERAKTLRDKISAVEHITQKQDAISADQTKDIDVLGLYITENEVQWVVMFLRSGMLTGRRAERTTIPVDTERLVSGFLELFYSVSLMPDEIWVPEDFSERADLEALLSLKAGRPFRILVKRGEKPMRLLGMAHENAKLIYEEHKRKEGVSASESLREVLDLAEAPDTIEGIDVSNLQGSAPAVALVHFSNEQALKSRYRIYYPRTVEGQNDFAMIFETVTRRFQDKENPPPDLLMIDGGKGQLASAKQALEDLGLQIPICSLAKSRTERGFTRKEVSKSEERIFVPGRKNPIVLKEGHPALRLLQQVRDEAHRFSVKSHRTRRMKQAMEQGALSEAAGIGEKSREKLLKYFGTIDRICEAPVEEWIAAGLNQKQAESLQSYLADSKSEDRGPIAVIDDTGDKKD